MEKFNKKYLLVILLLLVTVISVGYAALATTLNINGNSTIKKASWDVHFENLVKTEGSKTAEVEAAIDENNTAVNYTVKFSQPGDFYEFTVDVVNAGTIDAMISEILNAGLTTAQQKYIEYKVTYYDNIEFNEKDILKAGAKDTVKVRIKYRDDVSSEDLPTTNENITLSFQITYVQDDGTGKERENKSLLTKIAKQAVPDNIASTYVTSETGVDFSEVSSDTNGKGVYLLASTKNETNPIYYYRGAVENNNVRFAGFCWKIVRTTEKGGIKLVHNGTPDENGYCQSVLGDNVNPDAYRYNNSDDDNAYVGYMYGTPSSSTYEETHANINDSAIKTTIDNWYKTNMINYTSKLEDTVWCNDRSVFAGGAFGKEATAYAAYNRLYNNKTPSLECAQDNDKFTVGEENGNGALTYPVALLTADEVAYAGGVVFKDNKTFYLYSKNIYSFWTISPWSFVNREKYQGETTAYMFRYNSMYDGMLNKDISGGVYILPAIALAPGTECVEGDGTATNPYVIGD